MLAACPRMCSFNSIRGVPACANHRSMQTWARSQWNFSGYIVSDQGAAYGVMSSHKYAKTLPEAAAFAVSGGLDLEDADSSKSTAFAGLADAIRLGLLNESFVDASVSRLMFVRMRASSPHSTIIAVMHVIIPTLIFTCHGNLRSCARLTTNCLAGCSGARHRYG